MESQVVKPPMVCRQRIRERGAPHFKRKLFSTQIHSSAVNPNFYNTILYAPCEAVTVICSSKEPTATLGACVIVVDTTVFDLESF